MMERYVVRITRSYIASGIDSAVLYIGQYLLVGSLNDAELMSLERANRLINMYSKVGGIRKVEVCKVGLVLLNE